MRLTAYRSRYAKQASQNRIWLPIWRSRRGRRTVRAPRKCRQRGLKSPRVEARSAGLAAVSRDPDRRRFGRQCNDLAGSGPIPPDKMIKASLDSRKGKSGRDTGTYSMDHSNYPYKTHADNDVLD